MVLSNNSISNEPVEVVQNSSDLYISVTVVHHVTPVRLHSDSPLCHWLPSAAVR